MLTHYWSPQPPVINLPPKCEEKEDPFAQVIASYLNGPKRADLFARADEIDRTGLTALGGTGNDVVELKVVGVVGLDISGEAVKGTLDGFLGGGVHHAGLWFMTISQNSTILRPGRFQNLHIAAHHLGSS